VLRLVQLPVEVDPPLGVDEARRDGLELASLLGHELGDEHPGQPSAFACPDCHGVLFDLAEGDVHRYRCRVGHAWSAESLVDRQGQAVESALWMALRSLEERGALARRVAASAVEADRPWSVQHFQARAEEAEQHAGVLRRLLLTHAAEPPPGHPVDDPGHDRGLGLLG
jgi:two-component system chemotaxis response regulator CheB